MPLQFSKPQICQSLLFWFEDFDYKIELDWSWPKMKKGLTSLTPACHWEQRLDQEDPGSGRRGAVTPSASGGTRLEGSAPLARRRLPRHVKIRVQRRRTTPMWASPLGGWRPGDTSADAPSICWWMDGSSITFPSSKLASKTACPPTTHRKSSRILPLSRTVAKSSAVWGLEVKASSTL